MLCTEINEIRAVGQFGQLAPCAVAQPSGFGQVDFPIHRRGENDVNHQTPHQDCFGNFVFIEAFCAALRLDAIHFLLRGRDAWSRNGDDECHAAVRRRRHLTNPAALTDAPQADHVRFDVETRLQIPHGGKRFFGSIFQRLETLTLSRSAAPAWSIVAQDGKASANQLLRVFDVIRIVLARPVRAVEQNQRGSGCR